MSLLLNWRVWVALALAGALAFSHFTVYKAGKQNVRNEWLVAVAQANADARKLETLRQSRVDEAARIAVGRAAVLRRDGDLARVAADGLRSDLDAAKHWAAQSRAAADKALGVTTGLLEECSRLLVEIAEGAARADNEARELRQGWPE